MFSKNAFDREEFRVALPALLGKDLVIEPSRVIPARVKIGCYDSQIAHRLTSINVTV